MKSTKFIQIRVTLPQLERIVINAQAKGHKTISEYIRKLALEKDMVFERKFNELYKEIMKNKSNYNIKIEKSSSKNQEEFLI